MKLLALVIALLGSAMAPYAAKADLGPAEVQEKKQEPLPDTYDAWCAEKYADCKVSISSDRIAVDDGKGVTRENILSWEKRMDYRAPQGVFNFIGPHQLYTYFLNYKASDGYTRRAAIVFQHSRTSDLFAQRLRVLAPGKEIRCAYNFDVRSVVCQ